MLTVLTAAWGLGPGGKRAPTTVKVIEGDAPETVVSRLEQAGVVRSGWMLRLSWMLTGSNEVPVAGYHRVRGDRGALETWKGLCAGSDLLVRVTVPEGWSLRRIDQRLALQGLMRAGAFLAAAGRVETYIPRHPWLREGAVLDDLEGYCFPDTYFLPVGHLDPVVLIDLMLSRFEGQILKPFRAAQGVRQSLHSVLTLASIVELEAVRHEERARIAGVFRNRLEQGMRLGSDPTVEYALGWHQDERGLKGRDIAVDSPYNTYRFLGLPPGPIGNPGRPSFEAAMFPERTPDLYFVAAGDGHHVFTRSYRDHLAARRRIRGH
jgi:UPF0755 protein